MAEVQWIKLKVGMFDDSKIKYIEALPERDTIITIWVKLLTLAGKYNEQGFIMLSENLPYNEEMLANEFNRPLNSVRLALQTFEKLGMIEQTQGVIKISNWEKHQNVEGMEKIRLQTRERVRKHREQKRLEVSNDDVTLRNATEKNREEENRKDKEEEKKEQIPYKKIIEHLNNKTGKKYSYKASGNQRLIKARFNEDYKLDDFIKVIDVKVDEWLNNSEMNMYLRPETLFKSSNFDKYLNQEFPQEIKRRGKLDDLIGGNN
ncbi:phage replisome organizer N-terminal domain-containing protein [Mammaliicoccus sciuri]|uniref:phage replisome organizer N-terminal domain-containing protein n=1 Tax=Mammaliicoccus sciuri TaxID=1296 RepID=UPI001E5FD762|nr:phage replisome organizer N-terminal domain-containing protein [Mammaliicoccus sciuri]MCD8798656.1 phage replisome organizer N-terminal domain-containing protein [Mammaliicoccus sciuri]